MLDLRSRAFGKLPPGQQAGWQAEHELAIRGGGYLAAFDGSRLVAAGRLHDMKQCWNGRPVRMAGVATVAVAPEDRGRGAGRALMTAMLDLIASRGYPLSVLFPSTLPLYRSLGWEIAGTSYEAVIPAHALRSLGTPDAAVPSGSARELPGGVRRAGPDDAAEAVRILALVHQSARDSGPNLRDEETLRRALGRERYYAYLAADGLLMYTWQNGHDELFVRLAVASSAQTTRALWGIVGSHCWVADTVRAWAGPADPVWWLTREPFADAVDHDDWMLRVVDPAAAIEARGFPPAAELAVLLRIEDEARPGNSGLWRLKVAGGRGSLRRAGPGGQALAAADGPGGHPLAASALAAGAEPLAVGARGLAALYAGTPVATLRRAGLAAGGDEAADALLDGAFAARPFMLDRF